MTDFLLELRSEEIPARMQLKAKEDLARLFHDALAKAGLAAASVETFATPRRLALIATGLPLATEAVSEETKGPKVGAPPQAMEGFLRKTGLSQDQLVERDGVYYAVVEKAGRQAVDVLAEAIPAIIRAFPWPKSQRWGAASVSTESLRWVRPLQGIVALLGDAVVSCEIEGIVSGADTMGHRFHHSGPILIENAGDYIEKLRAAHVLVHFSERCRIIRDGAKAAAEAAGLTLVEDEGLVIENAGLTEWPVPMLGRFDPAFLDVPQEVIQLTARVNQKYFVCHDAAGRLANAFVCTANIDARDKGAAIVAGNEKVLAARLSDAKFFWEQDLKVALDDQAQKLAQITFHEKLGSVADKVERVAKLARWLVEQGIVKSSPERGGGARAASDGGGSLPPASFDAESPLQYPSDGPPPRAGEDLADQAERAARLCKADLVTGMVGEFPELQGIMGGYYARAQGESDAVADAIRDHYKPVGQGDDVPTAPVTVAVSLADKLDTLAMFFAVNELPTGSRDPFALRRAALGILQFMQHNELRFKLNETIDYIRRLAVLEGELSSDQIGGDGDAPVYRLDQVGRWNDDFDLDLDGRLAEWKDEKGNLQTASLETIEPELLAELVELLVKPDELVTFFADRLKVQQREAGVRHDLIDAVFSLGGEDDLVRLLARVKALQAYITTAEGANLLAAYKRAANILKQAEGVDKNTVAPAQAGAHHVSQSGTTDEIGSSLRWSDADLGIEESALRTALDAAEPKAAAALSVEDFEGAMAALATLRAPIDAFFEAVMVNDPDQDKRAFRLGLLARFRDAVTQVADFSKIEG
ncbi:glycine--tRNA ligase subunit beta [Sphingorhabdus sp.]|jgi:glycyl-tRNA synthetase beta chain|uniref:glycine--tRNA ligase subunit beta n=1 Tax=Sphingorhabdus sp. TaxID=1902408 RepID=UPI0037CA1A13